MLGHTANKRTAPEYAGAVCDLRRIYKNSRGLAASAQPMARPMCAPPKIQCHHSKVAGVSFSSPGLWQMTGRIISTLAVAIAIGPSLAYGSPACMTQSEARAKFPKATHLYMRKNCWSDSATNTVQARSAAMPVHSPRHPPRAAVPAPSPRPALAAVPAASPRPEPASNGIDPGTQCRLSPCE